MLAFKDFSPAVLEKNLLTGSVYADFSTCVAAANVWMRSSGIVPISVETLLQPNTSSDTSRGSYRSSGEMSTCWVQVLRVWHEVPALPRPSNPA
jgi:hypothetical protein